MLSFAPDAPTTTPEILTEVSAIPTPRGYASPPVGVQSTAAALADPSQGGARLPLPDGSSRVIVGTVDALYELSGTSWTDRSDVGGYSVGTQRWCFAPYGTTVLAGNKAEVLQYSASTTFASNAFAPKFSTMDVVEGVVIAGNCDDSGTSLTTAFGDQPHRWWCSPNLDNGGATATWEPDVVTGATSGLLIDTPGAITRICRINSEVVAYKEQGVYIGRFDGSDAVIRWACVAKDVGCAARDAVVSVGSLHYFPGDSDFYVFDGSRPVEMEAPIREWFFARMNRTYRSSIQALHDRSNKLIYWFYPVGTSDLTSCIVYHYKSNRWGAFDLTISDALEVIVGGITWDDLGTLYSTWDDLPLIAYDSPAWVSNTPVLSYFDTSNQLHSLSGGGGPMSVTTGWLGEEEMVSLCTRVRPKFRTKPSGGTITPSYVFALAELPTTEVPQSLASDRFDVLQSARYHRFKLDFDDETELEAIGARFQVEGEE